MQVDITNLFKINGQSMKFDLIHLQEVEFYMYRELIEYVGGEIAAESDRTFVKFTKKKSYPVSPNYAWAAIYNVRFIRKCIANKALVDPAPYRLTQFNALRDACVMNHFLFGCSPSSRQTQDETIESSSSDGGTPTSDDLEVSLMVKERNLRTRDSAEPRRQLFTPSPTGNSVSPILGITGPKSRSNDDSWWNKAGPSGIENTKKN